MVDIRNFTRTATPTLPFTEAAERMLPGWDVSLVFAGERRAQQLNVTLRNKDYVPNVLSYVVGKKSGEIIICPIVAKREAPTYGMSVREFTLYLFIHGLAHLEGMRHGARMEAYERAELARLYPTSTTHGTTHSNRHRHRHPSDEDRRRRGSRYA